METVDELERNAHALNDKKKYREVICLLNDSLLSEHNSAQLYAEKAFALHKFNAWELCKNAYKESLAIDSKNARANYCKSSFYFHKKEYGKATKCLKQAIRDNPKHIGLYKALGFIYNYIKDFDKAIKLYIKALEIEPESPLLKNALGDSFRDSKQFGKAEKEYKDAINIDSKYAYPYNGLGDIKFLEKNYEEAVEYYSKAISLDPNLIEPYYNRVLVYSTQRIYKEALFDFEKHLELKEEIATRRIFNEYTKPEIVRDFYYSYSQLKTNQIKKIIENPFYSSINELVNKIKDVLLCKDEFITHYTSLSAAKALILDRSLFRISEGTFLNDTSEGRELFNFLQIIPSFQTETNETIARPFSRKPFIGSFVTALKHDDLTLWRMYGKENKEEGKGCAITLNVNELSKVLDDSLIIKDENFSSFKTVEDFNFYRVAYRQPNNNESFIVPGLQRDKLELLNISMKTLSSEIRSYKEENTDFISLEIQELLNEIAFLFKSADYQYENEIRLVVKGETSNKNISSSDVFPKVFIEIQVINSYIKEITFGPKVDRAEEWAATFYYSLEKQNYFPKILISRLPFK